MKVFEPLSGDKESPIALDDEGIWRPDPGREHTLVRWKDVYRVDPGWTTTRLFGADGKALLAFSRTAFGDHMVAVVEAHARQQRWAREEAERAANPAAYEHKQAETESPPPSRVWIGWTFAGIAALAVAYAVWGVDALKFAAAAGVGLAVVIGFLFAVGWVATTLFGHTRLADAVVLIALFAAIGAITVFSLRGQSERKAKAAAEAKAAAKPPAAPAGTTAKP